MTQGLGERLGAVEHVHEAVVKRDGSETNGIGLAPVADHSARCQSLEHAPAAPLRPGNPRRKADSRAIQRRAG